MSDPEPKPAPKTFIRERQNEEPRGRWEDRCDFIHRLDISVDLVCDRPRGHKGMHTGRLLEQRRVIGYARYRW